VRAIIDGLAEWLKDHPDMGGVHIEKVKPIDEMPLPDQIPMINIWPRAKPRERQFLIGGKQEYNEFPEIELHFWESSMRDLYDAFCSCEALVEQTLTTLAGLDEDALNIKWREFQVDEYDGDEWESTFYYRIVVLMEGTDYKTY